MGHNISAIVLPGAFDESAARGFDLRPVPLTGAITLFHVDHYFTAYWAAVRGVPDSLEAPGAPGLFPCERVVADLVRAITRTESPAFAIVTTDYFGGQGSQWACVYDGDRLRRHVRPTINAALSALGVERAAGLDEFDTVGLGVHRSSPEHLARYVELCDELGV